MSIQRWLHIIQYAALGCAAVWALAYGMPDTAWAVMEPPNDPHYDKQHYLQQTGVPAAWEMIESEGVELSEVVVAIVDTGVDLNHPDLRDRLVSGANLLRPGEPPQDDNGHGTAVAGVIAAVTNNGEGIAGIAPNVKIMPIKAIGEKGVGEEEHLGEGIRFAVDNGADIVVLSLGLHLYSPYLHEIVAYAESKGVLLIAATGNDGKQIRYPAAYPAVVAVGGVSFTNEHKPDSNAGPEIDLSAPWFVFTTGLEGTYIYKEGTSMAAPQVAGAAALLLGAEPELSPAEVRERLRQTAFPLRGGWNGGTGFGMLQTDKALSEPLKPDMFEPNDRKEDARPVPVISVVHGEFSGGADEDWYVFEPPYPGEISVRVRGPQGESVPAELSYENSAGASIVMDLSDGKEVRLSSPSGRPVTARLKLTSPSASPVPYRMETDFLIYSDAYEPNDKAYEAFTLPTKPEQNVTGTFSKVGDVDWFQIRIDVQGTLRLRLETDTPRIDPELYVVRDGANGPGTIYDQFGEGDPEYTGDIPVQPGTYLIRVRNVKSAMPLPVAGEYKLNVQFEKIYFDDFEPNNRAYEATAMAPGSLYRGVFDAADDEDWFQFRLDKKSLVTIEIVDIPLDRYMYYTLFPAGTQQQYGKTNEFGATSMKMEHELPAGVHYIRLKTDAAFRYQQYGIRFKSAPLAAGFVDMDRHWALEAVSDLVNRGIVNGYDDRTFRPNGTLTRAEAATLTARAFELEKASGVPTFPDVPEEHWAHEWVHAAAMRGVIRGYPDGRFRPNEPVTRAEMTMMAAAAAGVRGKLPGSPGFSDVPLNHWAAQYIYAFVESGELNGFSDGTFRPNGRATRAEFAQLLYQLLR